VVEQNVYLAFSMMTVFNNPLKLKFYMIQIINIPTNFTGKFLIYIIN